MSFSKEFMLGISEIAMALESQKMDDMAESIAEIRRRSGRLFILGAGGSAGNAGHAVNDFRKLCGVEAYAPTDNISELTARVNDEGWDSVFDEWLKVSRLQAKDGLLIFSVGGGDLEKKVSVPIVNAINYGKSVGSKILGIVGRDGGYTKAQGDNVIVVPNLKIDLVTPYSESFQAIVWHCLVSNPILKVKPTKW